MHYVIHDNFDQVYAFWEIGNLVYMKMLAYCFEETLSEKNNSTLSPIAFLSDMIVTKTKPPSSKRKLSGNFVNCPSIWHWS